MNSANDADDTFNNNNNEKNKSIPDPIQGEVTSKRHRKSKEQKKEENEQLKEERRLKFRKALHHWSNILPIDDIELWQSDTERGLVFHPDTANCWKESRQIVNKVK